MRQNITIPTMKAIQKDQDYYFFRNMHLMRNTVSRAGYMSKDGVLAWFWVQDFETKKYSIYIFHKSGVVYPAAGTTSAGESHEASETCRIRCEAYDRDQLMVNPTPFKVPGDIPRNNRREYGSHN